jgi:PTH1 family peptidyl-tRNA hydrolase
MKLFVGLGNPGKKYEHTRHNVGFIVVDRLLQQEVDNMEIMSGGVAGEVYKGLRSGNYYLKPMTFMNDSGKAVAPLINFYKISPDDVFVIHDDLDIKLGEYKIQKGVGPKLHGGINSIEKELGTSEFWRVRIGVENRESENKIPGEAYVLMDFNEDEKSTLNTVISQVIDELQNTK